MRHLPGADPPLRAAGPAGVRGVRRPLRHRTAADLVDIYMCAEREEAAYGQVYTGPCAAQPAPLTPALEAAEPETEIEL